MPADWCFYLHESADLERLRLYSVPMISMLIRLLNMDVCCPIPYLLGLTLTLNLKGINRAIPDDEFEYFVDKFARRVASFDHFGIATAKQLVNKNSGFPTVAAWEETWDAFEECQKQPLFKARFPALIKAGVQVNVTFERTMGEELLRFVGSGPFDV